MHVYSTDSAVQHTLIGILGVFSFGIVYGLNSYLLPGINQILPFTIPPLLFAGVAYSAVFSAVYYWFANWAWNHRWIPELLVPTPDLTGHWEGYIKTSFDGEIDDRYLYPEDGELNPDAKPNEYQAMKASLDIDQTWRKMIIHFETGRSPSISTAANIQTTGTLRPRLAYLFQNNGPRPDEMGESEGSYEGAARFWIENDGECLDGHYYTGPGREHSEGSDGASRTNYGSAEFVKVSDDPVK